MDRVFKRIVKKPIALIVLAMLLAVGVTRAVSLTHEMTLHPDEPYFYRSSVSLRDKLLDFDSTYQAAKIYPEGAFVFQLPFHLLDKVLCSLSGQPENPRLWGRIASVVYYMLGCLLGALLLYRYFDKRPRVIAIYALVMTFALFHIEQSRYGTGDAISFFLLMGAIWVTALYLEKGLSSYLLFAGLTVGGLAAVKYPQLYFVVLPLGALTLRARSLPKPQRKTPGKAALLMGATLAGFVLLSPSALVNLGYIPQAISRELSSYMVSGNRAEVGSPLEHLVSLLMYQLFYSDIPLSLPIAAYGVVCLVARARTERSLVAKFFAAVVPLGMALFFIYNLFVTTVFFRTYYPYFCVSALYAAWGLGRVMDRRRLRPVALVLMAFMLVRGGFFIAVLSEPSRGDTLLSTLTRHEAWDERTGTVALGNIYHTGGVTIPEPMTVVSLDEMYEGDFPTLEPGQFLVTAPLEYCFASEYLFPIDHWLVSNMIDGWKRFKADNQQYYIGQPYPTAYYYLFGYWLHGTSGTMFEFPTNYVYYRSATP